MTYWNKSVTEGKRSEFVNFYLYINCSLFFFVCLIFLCHYLRWIMSLQEQLEKKAAVRKTTKFPGSRRPFVVVFFLLPFIAHVSPTSLKIELAVWLMMIGDCFFDIAISWVCCNPGLFRPKSIKHFTSRLTVIKLRHCFQCMIFPFHKKDYLPTCLYTVATHLPAFLFCLVSSAQEETLFNIFFGSFMLQVHVCKHSWLLCPFRKTCHRK